MNKELFKVVSSRTINVSRFEIIEDKLRIDSSDTLYSFVKIKPGICSIVETPSGFVVLKEYRYPIRSWSYEFVAGMIDDGETPEEAAIREIKEETGFVVDNIKSLGSFYPSFGATDEMIYLFYARCTLNGKTNKELTELIKYKIVKRENVEQLISSGEFKHGAGLAAWLKYILAE